MKDEKDAAMNVNGGVNEEHPLIRRRAHYLALAVLLSLSVAGWLFFEDMSAKRAQNRFNEYVDVRIDNLINRLEKYKMILQGGVGLFMASEHVSHAEWRAYIDNNQIRTRYPGIQGIGFSRVIRPAELAHHIQSIRAEGFPDYTVWPEGNRDEYTAIIYLEPFDAYNQRAFGYDMFSEPVRRAAMTRARDTGEVSISGRVILIQETDQDSYAGFLIYVPVYLYGMTFNSLNERRAAIQGYVYASFRMNDLMQGIFPKIDHMIDFKLYDGADISPAALMFDSHVSPGSPDERHRPMFSATRTLDLYGHQWTLAIETSPFFEAEVDFFIPKIILGGGIIISLLIFLMLKMLASSADRTQALAEKMTEDLRDSEREKLLILENADEIIAYHDRDRRLVWANNKYLAGVHTVTGLPATVEDVNGKKCFDAWGLGKKCNHCPVGKAIRTGTPQEAKLTPQNQPHWPAIQGSWLIRAAPVRDSAGTIIGAIEMAHEITDRLQAEDDLRDSEERYRMLFDQLPVGVMILDVKSQLPVAFNDVAASQLGYSREEFGRLRISDYEAVETPEQTRAHLERLLQHGENRFETLHRTKSGEIRNVLVNIRITSIKGQSFLKCVFQDITAEKQAEQELIARKAAEAASRHKSLFLSNMSHEIRTPMNAIMGFAQVLDRDPSLTPGQKEQIRIINRSGQHLLRLIDDILDISRIEAGRIKLNPIVFGLEDFLDDVENMFRSRTEAKGLQLIVERDAGMPGWVHGDEGKLRQVLVNLLGNSVKFTESGGISMRARSEPAAEHTGEDGKPLRLVFEVEDSGPGIPASEQERIFYAFEQVESDRIIEGTGLGLAISHRLVEMMGGTLAVDSVVGKGSCFHFSVLCEPAKAIQKSEAPESPNVVGLEPGSGPWRVLVVDDVSSNRDLLHALLLPLGFEVREAENGAEAIDIFEEWAPHAVLMDMRMPVMDGYEATRRIKATETGRTTPVIAVTASVFMGREDEVMATGVSAYLRKPFQPEELYETLGECLDLRYVYADEQSGAPDQPKTPALTQKSLTALPRDLLQAMAEAVAEGDMARLADLIRRVEPLDSTAAQGLKALAGRYDYTTLTELLKKRENDNE